MFVSAANINIIFQSIKENLTFIASTHSRSLLYIVFDVSFLIIKTNHKNMM
jgi:hypothetical protein